MLLLKRNYCWPLSSLLAKTVRVKSNFYVKFLKSIDLKEKFTDLMVTIKTDNMNDGGSLVVILIKALISAPMTNQVSKQYTINIVQGSPNNFFFLKMLKPWL